MKFFASMPILPVMVIAICASLSAIACSSSTDRDAASASPTVITASPTSASLPTLLPMSILPTTTPTASPTALSLKAQNRIAFRSADGSIYTISPDGTDLFRITEAPTELFDTVFAIQYGWPVWSPDGRHLLVTAYSADAGGGFATALLRVSAASTENLPNLIYADAPGTQGIGGVPHFPAWRPDSNAVSLIADIGDGLATFIVTATGEFGPTLSNGGPVYMDWSYDGAYLLIHTSEKLVLHSFDATGSRTRVSPIGNGSVSYRTPDFSPVTDDYLYVEFVEGERGLFVANSQGSEPRRLVTTDASSAFRWSPAGSRIAVANGDTNGIYHSLTVISPEGSIQAVIDFPLQAFWWSPDGKKLLIAAPTGNTEEVQLLVADAVTGNITTLARMQPSSEMSFVIEFFDQYTEDTRLWSPDSSQFVFGGIVLDGTTSSTAQEPQVWVIDAAGEASPVALATGGFGTWSPD